MSLAKRILALPRFVPVLAGLVAFGLVRTPIEADLRDRLVAANLIQESVGSSAMGQMSQSALMGTLGGLRSLVATYLVLEAFDHFSYKEWDELRKNFLIATQLEPREETHWTQLVWHLGINATANMQTDLSLPKFERDRRGNQYALDAVEIGRKGLEQLPESVAIRLQMAEVYQESKLNDPCQRARLYKEIVPLPGAPGYAERFHAYYLADCPGHEEEAYRLLMDLYRSDDRHHKGTLLDKIAELEKKLGIPREDWIPESKNPEAVPEAGENRGRGTKGDTLPGGIVIP